ncbi:hypothetical protein B0H11DRAFT_1964093 [Mycena galericulata]|nr:hypothetical protein B0H11DRAFT_1964093 [Mycena galericulata]
MHAALRADNINRLPRSLRVAASVLSAVDWEQSFEDLQQLLSLLRNAPASQCRLCLPVLYVALDPAGIPSPETMDTFSLADTIPPSVLLAIVALNGMCFMSELNFEGGLDLWPRVWEWTEFISIYRERLPHRPSEADFCLDLLILVEGFMYDRPTANLMASTPRFRILLVRAWDLALHFDEPSRTSMLSSFSDFLREYMRAEDPLNLAEIVEGAGGDFSRIALLVKRFLKFIVPNAHSPISDTTLRLLSGIMMLLTDINDNLSLGAELLSHGITTTLVTAMRALAPSKNERAGVVLSAVVVNVASKLVTTPSYRWMSEALVAGLLRAMVLCAMRQPQDIHKDTLDGMMDLLPAATVYYPVVSNLEAALADVRTLVATRAFRRSTMAEEWGAFEFLAEERLAVLKRFEAGEYTSFRACDNMECGKIGKKTTFKRCSACRQFYYCSQECQLADWGAGSHRQGCKSSQSLSRGYPDDLSTENISFMRALLHHDYQISKTKIAIRQMRFMLQYPAQPMLTVFNYTTGHLTIQIVDAHMAAEEFKTTPGFQAVHSKDAMAREARSGGRMALHLMVVTGSGDVRARMFPMRAENSALHDGLVRLARNVPSGIDNSNLNPDLLKDIRTVVSETEDVLRIH